MSRLDYFYRKLLLTQFFVKGWGKPENLKRLFEFRKVLSDRERCMQLVPPDYPIHIDKVSEERDYKALTGHFLSPFVGHMPGIMPKEVEVAHFEMLLPKNWDTKLKPVCVHLAGTGDHHFWRRRMLAAIPLLKSGIASIILENPYYGSRKPKQQLRSSLHNVSDLFVMGGALVLESLALFHWCERSGYGPLGITGVSMGGFMASLAATSWHKPIALIPILSWSTASSVFTEGVMSGAIPWKLLQDQYISDRVYEDEITKLIVSPEELYKDQAFQLGCDFASLYPDSVDSMKDFQDMFCNETQSDQAVATEQNKQPHNTNTANQFTGNASRSSHESAQNSAAQFHTTTSPRAEPSAIHNLIQSMKSDKAASLLPAQVKIDNLKNNMGKESLMFMRGLMDECTHLGNFSCPVDPSLIIIVAAKNDAYIPRHSVLSLEALWPGSEVRYIDSGHISAFVWKQDVFRTSIKDAFDRQTKKYYS